MQLAVFASRTRLLHCMDMLGERDVSGRSPGARRQLLPAALRGGS